MTDKPFTAEDALKHMTDEVQRLTFEVEKARQEGKEEGALTALLEVQMDYVLWEDKKFNRFFDRVKEKFAKKEAQK